MAELRLPLRLLAVVLAVFFWSMIAPRDGFTWFLEVLPVIVVLPLLALTYRHFRFTDLAYCLIALHAVILMVGGHYTYAEMPLFNWLRDALDLAATITTGSGILPRALFPPSPPAKSCCGTCRCGRVDGCFSS